MLEYFSFLPAISWNNLLQVYKPVKLSKDGARRKKCVLSSFVGSYQKRYFSELELCDGHYLKDITAKDST